MYRAYYRLTRPVNRKDIAIEDLFIWDNFQEAISRLDFIKDKGGMVIVSGASGVGKTTALRYFVEKLDEKYFKVAYAPLSTISPRDFYRQISILLCHTASYNKVQLFHNIQQTIVELAVKKKQIPIIILDDAHFLKTENFFELQLLSNFNYDSLSPVLFILVSQPHLIDRLKKPVFDAVYQRIKIHIPIEPLSLDQTRQLLAHTLCACGRNSADLDQLFDQQAIETIYSLSKGIQRKIVNIVDKVLMYGAANQLQTITTEAVYSISAEL